MADDTYRVTKTEEEWRARLSPLQYEVLREAGTERPFTGAYWRTKNAGTYVCAGCDQPLFRSEQKYSSGCGWPSFFEELPEARIEVRLDESHGMVRQEILCSGCGGHLGHVFPDGPKPTGTRYCVNSASIRLIEDKAE